MELSVRFKFFFVSYLRMESDRLHYECSDAFLFFEIDWVIGYEYFVYIEEDYSPFFQYAIVYYFNSSLITVLQS